MPPISFTLPLLLLGGSPEFLEDRFEMPEGFRIYKVAGRDLCGGSYDIAFDGEGRLLVGDGKQVRRLEDRDGDATYDRSAVIARGLGPRGPQGLLVVGDRLFAVGGDGIQLFEGYASGGELRHRGRIGARFNTGGDHAAHTILRGHDDYLYFITGDGGGTGGRKHITEESSPALAERACSVFRISPEGRRWECVGTGGRNAPNLGMNALGDLFSLDSDMEWHVDLPWWRPVRLNHWLAGGDQGWQGVGAYPPYFIDCLAGIHDVGRGSPDWGVFYEHHSFPERYRDAYFVCDYRSKSATSGGYTTAGRLFAFFLERRGARWEASMEVFAVPRPGARGADGRIDFAVVDVAVGPDGSLFVSDHGQGIWRIFHDPERRSSTAGPPPIVPRAASRSEPRQPAALLEELLSLPQPQAEWSRRRREEIRNALGGAFAPGLRRIAGDPEEKLERRLRALRYLSPGFEALPERFVEELARDPLAEMRGQAAWLLGIRRRPAEAKLLAARLVDDRDPFVRRRALEALTRNRPPREDLGRLVSRLEDPERIIRYAAMVALSHHPRDAWFDRATAGTGPQARLRALVAADLRGEAPPRERLAREVKALLDEVGVRSSREDRLDLLRVIGRFRRTLEATPPLRQAIAAYVLRGYPDEDRDIRWETTRLVGELRVAAGFPPLVRELERQEDPVTQFHVAQALARLPAGWDDELEGRAVDWFLRQQSGWFTEFQGKGLQFRQFWATVLDEFASRHGAALISRLESIDLGSQIGKAVLERAAQSPEGGERLVALYEAREEAADRRRILEELGRVQSPEVSAFLRREFRRVGDERLRSAALGSLARQPPFRENRPFLEEGLFHEDPAVFRACAVSLSRNPGEPQEDIAQLVLSRMHERRETIRAGERFLVAVSGKRRDGYEPRRDVRRNPSDREREAALGFWKAWFREEFSTAFRPVSEEVVEEKSNEDLRKFILADDSAAGSAERGKKIYVQLCGRCHGGTEKRDKEAVIFGPDLTGVTRRLSPEEHADALVYPSKVVAERFKGVVVQTQG
ncbi:MAG: hypothetical protein O7J95_15860, partial [Planctomycetota bacterium]|nr:hypothetical protein [Planctomycetota bacterium]